MVALLEAGASAPAGVGDRRRQLWSGCLVHSRQDDGVLDAEQLRDGRLDRVVRHRLAVRCGKQAAARRLWSEVARLGGRQRPGLRLRLGDPNPTQCTELQLDTVLVRTCRLSLRDAPGEVHTLEPTARPAPGLDQLYYPLASPPLLATP